MLKMTCNSTIFRVICFLWLVWGGNTPGLGQNTPLKKGIVVDTLQCSEHPDHSYAYYLPSYYDASRRWPIIYIFEPAARGALPVDSFRMAAERYGYILVGSNNSRNGPWDAMFEAADNLFADVEKRFSIDINRRYTSGFSGGARMAIAAAVLSGKIAGVIGCGAATPNKEAYRATEQSKFVYYGLVGDRDMNFLEMYILDDQLRNWKIPSRLQVFEAGHIWPQPQLLQQAVEWMEVQAMNRNLKEKNSDFLNEQEQALMQQMQQLEKREKWYELGLHYHYLVQDFESDDEKALQKLKELEQSESYQQAANQWKTIHDEEYDLRLKLTKAIGELEWEPTFKDSIRRVWKKEVALLREKEQDASKLKSQMASRVINLISAYCVEWGWDRMGRKEYDKAIQLFKLWAIIQPDFPWAYYNLARAQALFGKKKTAIKSLKKALDKGLDKERANRDPAFDTLKNSKKYKKLMASKE